LSWRPVPDRQRQTYASHMPHTLLPCTPRRRASIFLCTLLCSAATSPVTSGPGPEFDVEPRGRPKSRVQDPIAAWHRALDELPAGARVRRLAFADHVLFVFHSPPGESRILSLTLTPTSDGFVTEDAGERDASTCEAAGVEPQRIESALSRVLESEEWRRHASRMDTLILECFGQTLSWMLMPVPEGGYVEGVAIETVSLPFEPAPGSATPALERD